MFVVTQEYVTLQMVKDPATLRIVLLSPFESFENKLFICTEWTIKKTVSF